MSVAEIYGMFPNLKERANSPGTRLSGGEQQMLAVARILRTGARLLLLDEISEGLAPVIVQKLAEMIRTLKAKGYTIVLVEQNFRFAAPLADRFYVMEHGRIVKQFAQRELHGQHGHAAGIPRRLGHAVHRPFSSLKETLHETQEAHRRMRTGRRGLFGAVAPAQAQISGDVIKIGFITDMSSLYADIDGPAGVEAIQYGRRRHGRHDQRQEDRGALLPTTRTRPTWPPPRRASGSTRRAWTC